MRRITSFIKSPLGLLVLGLFAIWLYSRMRNGGLPGTDPQLGQQRFGIDHIAATKQPVVHTSVGVTTDSSDL